MVNSSFLPAVCQVYLTRRCNESCTSCNLRRNDHAELSLEEWKEIVLQLDRNGVRLLKLMGGEPTMFERLPDLIHFVRARTNVLPVVLSNCRFSQEVMNRLVDSGLWGFLASYDFISPDAVDLGMQRKANLALEMMLQMKNSGVPFVGANVVVASYNLEQIPSIVNELTSNGLWTNLCPVICGGQGEFIFRAPESDAKLTNEHRERVRILSNELILMKLQGALLTASTKYLEGLSGFGIDQNWHCQDRPPLLQLDSDGTLLACPDVAGARSFNVSEVQTAEDYRRYLKAWRQEVTSCSGCYWSSTVSGAEDALGLPEYAR